MGKHFTRKELEDIAKEEKITALLYKRRGFGKFSLDEARHARFFHMLAEKMKRRRRIGK